MQINGNQLTIADVTAVAHSHEPVELAESAKSQIEASHQWVMDIVEAGKPVYGINTGFGIFSETNISREDAVSLNRNLILSHAVGTGSELPEPAVRAAMLIRANTLASGFSGIRVRLIENLINMLNKRVTPVIPEQGSLGSSGDLAPLSHLALVLSRGENDNEADSGFAYFDGQRMSGKAAMTAAGIERLILAPKEGLAITNGATFSAALAALAIDQAARYLDTAEVGLAMSLEALMGASNAFDERIHAVRKQTGQLYVASRVRDLTQGSTLVDGGGRVQDAYSLRCAPQVQGPARDTLDFVRLLIEREINAVTDNPLIFGPGDSLSGGNFHGEPVAMAMDFLKIAMSEVAAISERRTYHLTDAKLNAGLPPMLTQDHESAGLHSGMMMPQYTAVSLVLENQHLSAPDSVHSLPTSGGKEDHNANSMTAARNAVKVLSNCAHVLAVELYCASRALDLRLKQEPGRQPGKGTVKALQRLRKSVPFTGPDSWWSPEIERVKKLVEEGAFAQNVQVN
jgi:histidine ammonia-lyase